MAKYILFCYIYIYILFFQLLDWGGGEGDGLKHNGKVRYVSMLNKDCF